MQNWLSNFQSFSFKSSNFQFLLMQDSVRTQLRAAVNWAKTTTFWLFFFFFNKFRKQRTQQQRESETRRRRSSTHKCLPQPLFESHSAISKPNLTISTDSKKACIFFNYMVLVFTPKFGLAMARLISVFVRD